MKNKCRIIVGIILLFLISCKTETVSKDEYEVLNLYVNQILEPTIDDIQYSKNFEKIFSKNLTSKEELNKIDSIKKNTPFTYELSDSLFQINTNNKIQHKLIWELIYGPDKEIYKGLPLDFSRLKLQKNYNRIPRYTPETKNFLGKFKISRIVFSKRHERAYFEYHKSDSTSLDKFEINYIVATKEQGVWKVKQWSGYSTK
jgi:hypothetical protein